VYLPLVARRQTDQRERGTYANFMRAALGTYTFLFMGFSFTDAYLNELRSEVLAFLNSHDEKGQRPNPVGYAILEDQAPSVRTFFEQHEGIEVLHYETEKKLDPHSNQLRPVGWMGFTDWLEAIEKETCVAARLRALLGEQAQIVWIDPQHNDNNQRGLTLLRNHVGVNVAKLDHPDQLDKTSHQHAVLVISHFGYNSDGPSQLAKALENMQLWGERPPVVVFGGVDFANQNRRLANRLGAIDLATNWTDLMRVIEQMFGRDELNSGPDAATQTGFSRATISPSKQQT